MHNNSLYTKKQLEVMYYLFKVRGANVPQIVEYYKGEPSTSLKGTSISRMYEMLRRLQSKNIVTNTLVGHRESSMYHLTPYGLELIYEELEIEYDSKGNGFNNEHGYFPYHIYKPPTKASRHFLNQTAVHTTVLNIQKRVPGVYDYRDNLYSKIAYEYPEGKKIKKGIYRPDGELRIEDDFFFIEVDRQTERNSALELKFANLRQYLTYLVKANKPLPKGILFIREETTRKGAMPYKWAMRTRYNKFFVAFQKECKQFLDKVDLLYMELPNLNVGLVELLQDNKMVKTKALTEVLERYKNAKQSNIRSFEYITHDEFVLLRIQEPSKKFLYIFAPMEGYESRLWQKGKHFYQTQKEHYDEVLFIAYYHRLHTIAADTTIEKKVTTKEELDFYNHVYHLNITSPHKPVWFDHDHKSLAEEPF